MDRDPLDILRNDHRHIDRILCRVLEAVESARTGSGVDARLFGRAAEFLRVFVEGAHFAREQALHAALEEAGLPRSSGLLAQLGEEHAHGREQTKALCALARQVAGGEGSQEGLVDDLEAYARMHRTHTLLEEREVMPLAQRLLKPPQTEALRSQFARIEARFGPLEEAALALELAFGPGRAAATSRVGMGGARR